ncbi:MAG: E3 binding domain-containing protein, partial [Bradymonadaceae bacterium]
METDKIAVEVPAPVAGVIKALNFKVDDSVNPGDVLAEIEPGENKAGAEEKTEADEKAPKSDGKATADGDQAMSPAVQRLVEEHDVDVSKVDGTGPSGRVLKGDVLEFVENQKEAPKRAPRKTPDEFGVEVRGLAEESFARPAYSQLEERVTMTKLRQTVARRLVEAQQNAAMLTTFNEVDMSQVMALRSKHKDSFLKKYDVKLGFM